MFNFDKKLIKFLSNYFFVLSINILFLIACAIPTIAQPKTEQWDFVEIALKGTKTGNPFVDVQLSPEFAKDGESIKVDGLYDAEGIYKIRFIPDQVGKWNYNTTNNELNNKKGSIECVAPSKTNKGPVRVNNKPHFSYSDGTPYTPVGTTCYAWLHQTQDLQEQTLQTLKESPFNKLRMTIFPKYFDYNRKESAIYPYDKGHWGFDRMGRENDHHYLKYVIARFSAFRNIWWSMANEFDLMNKKTMEDWDSFFDIVKEKDPYNRLTSIHNGNINVFYDHSKPFISHVSVQNPNLKETHHWRKYGKPVINDECEYEGNLPMPWGNISAQELVHRAWLGYGYGIYVGHGETYDDDVIWWSHGGTFKGEGVPRFAFLKKIMEETSPEGLNDLDPNSWLWLRFSAGKSDKALIFYFGEHQPAKWPLFQGEEEKEYSAEVIDTWNMTVTKIDGKFKKGSEIPMPGKPYMALRL